MNQITTTCSVGHREHTESQRCEAFRGTAEHKNKDRVVSTLVSVLSVRWNISTDERNRTAMLKRHKESIVQSTNYAGKGPVWGTLA